MGITSGTTPLNWLNLRWANMDWQRLSAFDEQIKRDERENKKGSLAQGCGTCSGDGRRRGELRAADVRGLLGGLRCRLLVLRWLRTGIAATAAGTAAGRTLRHLRRALRRALSALFRTRLDRLLLQPPEINHAPDALTVLRRTVLLH